MCNGNKRRRSAIRTPATATACAAACAVMVVGVGTAFSARADISDFSGFILNGDAAAQSFGLPTVTPNNDQLILSDAHGSEATSAFSPVKQDVTNFLATFYYQALISSTGSGAADGFTFLLQNDPRGTAALGDGGGTLGYGGSGVISKSVADTFNVYSGNGGSGSNYSVNGHSGAYLPTGTSSGGVLTNGVDITTGDFIQVQLSYRQQDARLVETLTDQSTGGTWQKVYTNAAIPTTVGGTTAYVGFTAGTGGVSVAQKVLQFTYQAGAGQALPGTVRPDMTPISFTGFNHDVVIDAAAAANPSTAGNFVDATMDAGTAKTGNTWYEQGFVNTNAWQASTGLPMGKVVQSQDTQAMANSTIQFGPASGNNALLLNSSNKTGKLTLSNVNRYSQLAIYETSGNGGSGGTMTATLNFLDGRSPVTLTPMTIQDWFGNATSNLNYGYITAGRATVAGASNNVGAGNPRIYENDFDLSAYVGDPIGSVSFNWAAVASNTQTTIFAMSGTALPAANLVWNQAAGTWDTTVSNTPWMNTASSTSAPFFSADIANFTDAAVGPVNITGAGVYPNSTTVSHTSGTYTFNGGGILSGSLTKTGAGTLVLANAANTFSDATVSGGSVVVGTAAGTASAPLTVSGTLNVGNNASVVLSPSAAGVGTNGATVHSVGALNLNAAGVVNLNNNAMVVSSTTPVATVRNYLQAGYSNGNWNGTSSATLGVGAITSTWAANDTSKTTGLGYVVQPNGTTLVAATLYGDTTLKGSVGLSDYNTLAASFNKAGTWAQGDFDYDGAITLADYNKLATNFNKSAQPGGGAAVAPTAAKPATLTGSASPAASVLPAGVVDPGAGNVALEADPTTGKIYIVGHDSNINSYEVDSAAGKLTFVSQKNHGGYNTLTAQSGSTGLPGSALGQNEDIWATISSAAGTFVAEAYPAGSNPAFDTLGPGLQTFDLNVSGLSAWTAGTPISDLTFKYGNGTGNTLTPAVIPIGVPEPTCLALAGIAAGGLLSRKRRRS